MLGKLKKLKKSCGNFYSFNPSDCKTCEKLQKENEKLKKCLIKSLDNMKSCRGYILSRKRKLSRGDDMMSFCASEYVSEIEKTLKEIEK